jgi:hypothetical protein
MDREPDSSQKLHFHIHWNKNDRLDWEAFNSHNEALSRALEIAQRGEMFAIQGVSEPCRLYGTKAGSAS